MPASWEPQSAPSLCPLARLGRSMFSLRDLMTKEPTQPLPHLPGFISNLTAFAPLLPLIQWLLESKCKPPAPPSRPHSPPREEGPLPPQRLFHSYRLRIFSYRPQPPYSYVLLSGIRASLHLGPLTAPAHKCLGLSPLLLPRQPSSAWALTLTTIQGLQAPSHCTLMLSALGPSLGHMARPSTRTARSRGGWSRTP